MSVICPCETDGFLRELGQAEGWLQCSGCGRLHQATDEAYPLPQRLRHDLRECWHMRHGGGVSRKTWLVVGHGLEAQGHEGRKARGYDWSFQEAQSLHRARQTLEDYLERGADRTELWEIGADGLCALWEQRLPAWTETILVQGQRRARPSALAAIERQAALAA